MGEILTVQCSCGYEASDLFVGCGMAGHDWCRELATCANCREVVTIRTTRKRRCPRCRHALVIVQVPELAGGGSRGDVPLDAPCPTCGKEDMRVTTTGLWD